MDKIHANFIGWMRVFVVNVNKIESKVGLQKK